MRTGGWQLPSESSTISVPRQQPKHRAAQNSARAENGGAARHGQRGALALEIAGLGPQLVPFVHELVSLSLGPLDPGDDVLNLNVGHRLPPLLIREAPVLRVQYASRHGTK